jgi:LPPG:FO 2-phospho-L-lactate transferase
VDGLYGALGGDALSVVVNTADDFEHWGLWVCPDLDTVMYTLSGVSNPEQGWGLAGETFEAMGMMTRLGGESWFKLGDRDLATHLTRTSRLRAGDSLTEITAGMNDALGVECRVLPMCDAPCQSRIETRDGRVLEFQEWFVRHQGRPALRRIFFEGETKASTQVLQRLEKADLVIITPSNPYVSIDPVLSLEGVREILERKVVVGVSPIVGGRAVKGPLGAMIPALTGKEPSAKVIVEHYGTLLDGMVTEAGDETCITSLPVLGASTIMGDRPDRERLAREVLEFAGSLR